MDPSAGREQQVKYGGLVVAGVGFILSRATLLVVVDRGGSAVAFLTTGFLPLSVGLALTAFGVSLAVSTFEPWYVNTVAAWTLAGTAGMGLVAALSAANPMLAEGAMLATAQSSALVANTLIGVRSAARSSASGRRATAASGARSPVSPTRRSFSTASSATRYSTP